MIQTTTLLEVRAALEQLLRNTPDMLRLEKISRLYARGLQPTEGMDLLNEAFARALEGKRRWPRNVPIVAFLAQVMRGLASDIRDSLPTKANPAVDLFDDSCEGELNIIELIKEIMAIFKDDEEALSVLEYRIQSYSPKEVQDFLNMTPTQYGTILKRIRRKWLSYRNGV